MKKFIVAILVFIFWVLVFWGVFCALNTVVFCMLFEMHPAALNYEMNHFYMIEINKLLVIPAFFITKYLLK